jgi:hypothetical protein
MYRFKKVYMCDHCGKVALPAIMLSPSEHYKTLPDGWNKLGKEHLCDKCSTVYKRFLDEVSLPTQHKIGF